MKHKVSLGPAQVLVVGFFIVIVVGACLLSLPIASNNNQGLPFLDALFTATSAVCVTGLVVVNTYAHWTLFGKIVIISLIQIGGLGFMTLVSMIYVLLGRKITLKDRLVMQEALSQDTIAGVVKFTKTIVKGTLLVEGAGALLLSITFIPEYGFLKGAWYSIFHAISGFCNAGFDIVGDASLIPYVGNPIVNLTITSLIVLGGLGFGVWMDLIHGVKVKMKMDKRFTWKQTFDKLSLHTKLVVTITLFLIGGGFLFFFIAEFNNPGTLGALPLKDKMFAALFQSISPRTAGFNTIALDAMKDASKFMMIILMFIGGSPAGTAGGIKTIAAGVLVLATISTVRGRESTEAFHRRIPLKTILRALSVIMIALGLVLGITIILSFTEDAQFIDLLFETVSGFATVGSTLGITPNLSFLGKIIIIIDMFIGRLGPVTMVVAMMIKQGNHKSVIQYPEEKIIV
ncbi:MAG TPA: Trk family potassium uptake protein [Epulopiscium sp.]|nr:Trk family potassium uptake protein [Candidatus Epulonipiscium sp.]